ncbi:MAG: DUF3604 domain-containing protein [Myxococcota bacterium]
MKTASPLVALGAASILVVGLAGCRDEGERASANAAAAASTRADETTETSSTRPEATPADVPAPSPDPDARHLYFGDLHVHTAWSFDAYERGVRTEPDAAYRFARGEPIPHAAGGTIQLVGPPLDFLAVTDHAEYLGVAASTLRPSHPLHRQPLIRSLMSDDLARVGKAAFRIRQTLNARRPLTALVSDDIVHSAWQEVIAAANAHDRPGTFTAFVGYEYTSNPDRQNLHRNLIFRGDDVPDRPFTTFDSEDPEALWRWMDAARASGDDVLAIPHNANGSNGLMFATERFDGSAIDAEWAALRARNEPVAEVFQIKGQSETTPRLSPDDPWADFEVVSWRTLDPSRPSREAGSYTRPALLAGLAERERLGVNPFELGYVGSTDTHNAASPVVESTYFGKLGLADGTPETRLARFRAPGRPAPTLGVSAYWSAAGLAGVWASENTRAALFDAIRRRETFATSGPRMRVRLSARLERAEAAPIVVPMGGRIEAPAATDRLTLEVEAQKDPFEAPLERVQLIKLWLGPDGARHEAIRDLVCRDGAAPAAGAIRCADAAPAPDPARCEVDPSVGARELGVRWTDPDFDPKRPAAYAVRVLQVPTCRWSSFDAQRLGQAPPPELSATIQERAVTSSIWVLPALARRP